MYCQSCHSLLGNNYICPTCGRESAVMKKIIRSSNWHYNQGLAKAKVKDLTGATIELKSALKYNKLNTDARNLLGLIYYQTGEVVMALGEWVISVNFQPYKNRAQFYIDSIQKNQQKLAVSNKTIQKYNTALEYLKEHNFELAIIELKKAVNISPKYIKAYQLLALVYIETKQYDAALNVLKRTLQIDRNNITSLRYINEVVKVTGKQVKLDVDKEAFTQIKDPNPLVIQRDSSSGVSQFNTSRLTFINIVIGLIVGIAVIGLLVVPSVKRSLTSQYNESVVQYSNQISQNNRDIANLTTQVEDLTAQNELLRQQADYYNSATDNGSNEAILASALKYYLQGNTTQAGVIAADIDKTQLDSSDQQEIYDMLIAATRDPATVLLYNDAYTYYVTGDYVNALARFVKILNINDNAPDTVFYTASCYQHLADIENAAKYYNKLIAEFPDNSHIGEAQAALRNMGNSNN